MWHKVLFCLLVVGYAKGLQYHLIDEGLGDHHLWYQRETAWPLAVLADRQYSLSADMTSVPLLAVPSHDMALLSKPYVSGYSPESNLVTCQLNKFQMEAVPAVKIELPLPVLLSGDEGLLRFPSHLSVEAQGVRFMMPVGALLAPVPEHPYSHSSYHLLNVVYAVPAFTFRQPIHHINQYPSYVPITYPKPNEITSDQYQFNKNTTPIRVLEFPNKISTPPTLSGTDEELVNRGPPEEVAIPAGLVQSAQPTPFLTNFVNAKESTLLQSFRDEALKHRDYNTGKPAVEAL